MAEKNGMIFKIERFRLEDGPGIRTTVFIKGCPLRCLWCSNPESQAQYPEVVYNESLCIPGCQECIKACPENGIIRTGERIVLNRSVCKKCHPCAEVCDAGALRKVGDLTTVGDLYREIERDIPFYQETQGGMTVSGGEPLTNPEFTRDLLKACREKEIHTALDTTGYGEMDEVLRYTDLVLFDIKQMDSRLHKKYTGVGNEIILENVKKISDRNIPMIIRVPVIPGMNDSGDDVRQLIEFLKNVNFMHVDLLPYHGLGAEKYAQLGREYPLEGLETPNKTDLEAMKQLYDDSGIACRIQV